MDIETRTEIDKLHERVSDLKERVVNLEAQNPHINASLSRIEKSVHDHRVDTRSALDKLNGHLIKAIWVIIALFLTAVWRSIVNGNIPGI